MIEIALRDCKIEIAANQAQKIIIFTDNQSGIRIVVPLTTEAATQISRALAGSGIIVPTLVPLPVKGNTH